MDNNAYIVGEDPVTIAVIRRLVKDYAPVIIILDKLPARGSQIKEKFPNFLATAQRHPVISLLDLDNNTCAPILKKELLGEKIQPSEMLINIAVDEAEAWLMADKVNFATYAGLKIDDMPSSSLQKQGGRKALVELQSPIKTSLQLTHVLALKSSKREFMEKVGVPANVKACKGNQYNDAIVPFVEFVWNPEIARKNSDSLDRMINRLVRLNENVKSIGASSR